MLKVEDGTGFADALTYVPVEEADAAAEALGDTGWLTSAPPAREAALALGATYVDNGMIYRYSGSIAYVQQVRAWPRRGAVLGHGGPVIETGVIPHQLKQGQIAAALLARVGALPTQAQTGPGRPGEIASVAAEGVSVKFADPSRVKVGGNPALQMAALGHPLVTGILAPLLDDDVHRIEHRVPIVGGRLAGSNTGAFWEGMHSQFAKYATGVHSDTNKLTLDGG